MAIMPYHFFSRYPLATTRMWNLLSIFDPPAYANFFISLTLTVVLLKVYTYFGTKLGMDTVTEEFILVPTRYTDNMYLSMYCTTNQTLCRFEIVDVGNTQHLFSIGISFKLLHIWHCLFGGVLL